MADRHELSLEVGVEVGVVLDDLGTVHGHCEGAGKQGSEDTGLGVGRKLGEIGGWEGADDDGLGEADCRDD